MIAEALCAGASVAGVISFRYAWWRAPVSWAAPRVLMYHMVRDPRPGARFNKLRVSPQAFARQLDWLCNQGFEFVFASQLFSSTPPPQKAVCLTFDDGYADNLSEADPILERYRARATLYLVTERNGGWSSLKKSHHSDDELQSEPKLTDEQIQLMTKSGRWELGAHTRSHANLVRLDDESAREEIGSSIDEFGARFRTTPATFAYPFGMFDPRHVTMVQESGYCGAVTTEPGIESWPYADPCRVPRIKVSGTDNLAGFIMRVRGGKRGLLK